MIITASDITFERWYQPVFEPVSLAIAPGETLLVTGANGSGKTTLLRVLAGLLPPTQGQVERTTQSVYLGHQLAVKDDLTVRENLGFMQGLAGQVPGGIDATLRRLGIEALAGREVRNLSAGQRKRCALGRLMMSPARLWLLDEPYANLDTDGAQIIDALLEEHLHQGGAAIMCTHGSLKPSGLVCRELEIKGVEMTP